MAWKRAFFGLLFAFLGFIFARTAIAHPAPGSVAIVDFTVSGARLEQDVPIQELELALHERLILDEEDPVSAVRRNEERLHAYALRHVEATSAGGERWKILLVDVQGHPSSDGPRVRFRFDLSAPEKTRIEALNLHDDLVAHEVVSHYTTVYARSDWATGEQEKPRLAGTIHAGRFDVLIPREGSWLRGVRSVIALGAKHIATGSDHLLFLFALVLVAPVRASRGRWIARREVRGTLRAIVQLVTAFTLGHSLTLAMSALAGVLLPATIIEVLIALSILLTAAHAARPLFPRREALVAGLFGLVHGLAFAETLAGRDLGLAQTTWTLLGFNTGIKLAQLLLLALVLPWLLLLASTRFYPHFRRAGAAVAGVLACGWLVERTTSLGNPVSRPLGWIESNPLPLLFVLAVTALLARFHAPETEASIAPYPSR